MPDIAIENSEINGGPALAELNEGRSRQSAKRISLQNCAVVFMAADVLTIAACGIIAKLICDYFDIFVSDFARSYTVMFVGAVFGFSLFSKILDAYRGRRIMERVAPIRRLVLAIGLAFLTLLMIGVVTKTAQNYSRLWFFSWAGLSCVLAPVVRLRLLSFTRQRLENGAYVFRALSVGMFADPIAADVIKDISDGQVVVVETLRLESFHELESLADPIAIDEIDRIYIVTPWVDAPVMLHKLLELRQFSTEIFLMPDDSRIHAFQLGVSTIGDRISLHAAIRPINGWDLWVKRVQDVVVASATLFFFAPLMLLIALAIRLDSPGPVLFRQQRVGFNGRHFELLKFRSMHFHSTDNHAARQTSRNDGRVTAIGRFIRRTSIDELPQFINVLQGDMSVVGPRPHALLTRTNGVALSDIADQYAARHRVRPGLTGWAQVNGYRGELDTNEKVKKRVEYDIEYIENWSTWLDIKIILRTALLVVYDPAAY